jgi:hypothetical protein
MEGGQEAKIKGRQKMLLAFLFISKHHRTVVSTAGFGARQEL